MTPNPANDSRSPWYEPFLPEMQRPAPVWFLAEGGDEPAEPAVEPADDDWATEALFDYYNS